MTVLYLAACSVALVGVLLLPGFAVLAVGRRLQTVHPEGLASSLPDEEIGENRRAEFVLALAWGFVLVSVVGGSLVAAGWFSGGRMALVAAVTSAVGLPSFVRWVADLRNHAGVLALLACLGLPWAAVVTLEGLPSAVTFQSYYWLLGKQLSAVGGVPGWVLEYGERVRWQPDYVFFNVLSEAYRGVLTGVDETIAITAWPFPVAVLGIAMLYLASRLWMSRPAAFACLGAVVTTAIFLRKFDAYKPEALGVVLGLAVVWLVVKGLRQSRASWLVLAGVVWGLTMGVHAIAAAVIGLLVVAAGIAEGSLGAIGRTRTARTAIIGASACAIGVVLVTGLALQGRAVVATDATRPETTADFDPTWAFLQRSRGLTELGQPVPIAKRVAESVRRPWPGVDLGAGDLSLAGPVLAAVLIGLGLLVLVRRGERSAKRGVLTILGTLTLLMAVVALFALAFATYVPQHTGVTRFAQYAVLLGAFLVGFAVEGWILFLRRSSAPQDPMWAIGIASFVIGWAVPTALATVSVGGLVSVEGVRAVEELSSRGQHGEVVLSNANTHGLLEFATGLESPIEGRQPLIEDPTFLSAANARLLDSSRFFRGQDPRGETLDRLRVTWVLVSDRPELLGTSVAFGDYGGTAEVLRTQRGLTEVWRGEDLALFRSDAPRAEIKQVSSGSPTPLRWAVGVILLTLMVLLVLRRPRSASQPPRAARGARSKTLLASAIALESRAAELAEPATRPARPIERPRARELGPPPVPPASRPLPSAFGRRRADTTTRDVS